jgi:hypothetical protein
MVKQKIKKAVKNAKDLNETKQILLELFQEIRNENDQIGYVAGILFSDGLQYFERNRQLLAKRTEIIRNHQQFPIFSAYDIFSDGLYDQIEEKEISYQERRNAFINFWRGIVGSGFVTDIFMTPRWEFSEGARDEHETAQKFGLTIHYFNDEN